MPVIKVPGPDHPITITKGPKRVTVRFGGTVVADTRNALTLRERHYRPVFYVPRQDAEMAHFVRSSHATYCPYKGDAAYYSLQAGGSAAEDAVWSYERPYPAMAKIAGYLAFYPDKVEISEGS
jgi:uncharacterized protein (DUF427 family)